MAKNKAKSIVDVARLGGKARAASLTEKERVAIAKMGGNIGGQARAKALSAKKRSAIAKKAAKARWGKPGVE